ncbi:MAG: fimbrial biogenesis outer membrane usher protein [Devosia sp.]|nr:fimbrial biogenesis outer membrane usher protein [Devosia sp.]
MLAGVIVLSGLGVARAIDIPDAGPAPEVFAGGAPLYLDMVINGISRDAVVAFVREADGTWTARPESLREAGLLPAAVAVRPDGRIDLGRLPGVRFVYDEPGQAMRVNAEASARSELVLKATRRPAVALPVESQSGGLLNYAVALNPGYAASAGEFTFGPMSAAFEARAYGPFGVVSHGFVISSNEPSQVYRQQSSWRFAQPEAGWRFIAGDLVTGSLGWTRPTRLGGLQVQNDFALQSDVVTFPVPGMSGSAALPSTAEVWVNGVRRYSASVPDGPFVIEDLPLDSGPGTASLVVRDAMGQAVTITRPFYVARELLRTGLLDYSFEVGHARIGMATDTDHYDDAAMASASLRYGLADWLTLEGHAEGGGGLFNLGGGLTTSLLDRGVLQVAVSGSVTDEGGGYQAFGAIGLDVLGVPVRARLQGTFGAYHDIGSFTYRDAENGESGGVPRFLAQLSASVPTPIEKLRLNLSFAELQRSEDEHQRLLGVSLSQPLWGGGLTASGTWDLIDDDYRLLLGYSWQVSEDKRASISTSADDTRLHTLAQVGTATSETSSDASWRLGYSGGERSRVSADLKARFPALRAEASIGYDGEFVSGSALFSGAIVANAAGILFASPISDAFAVVDAGYAGVPVLVENKVVGATGSDGRLVVPTLRGLEANRIGIDPAGLPLDAMVLATRRDIRPADGSGVVVALGAPGGGSALVTFRDGDGVLLPVGATGRAGAAGPEFMIGYDGMAYLVGLADANRIEIDLGDGRRCVAELGFSADPGQQTTIPDAICRPA